MEDQVITVRAATSADIPDMWRLLHCEGRDVDEAAIGAALGDFFVLTRGMALLGVYYNGVGPAAWTAAHPLFGQQLVEDIIAKAVNGLFNENLPTRCEVREWSFNLTKRRSFQSISN